MRLIGKRVLGNRGTTFVRRCLRRVIPDLGEYRARLDGKRALEIGGPSDLFTDRGSLPLYSVFSTVDNCLFSVRTIWTGEVEIDGGFQYLAEKSPGIQFICEATNLAQVPDSSYDVVLASHCLEHVANPLQALKEWKRVLAKNGLLLLVLPHKDGTFDWRRAVTPLEHIIQDYENNTREDDLTHLPEILTLHDLEKDPPAGSPEQFKARCMENSLTRAMHHHVFDTHAAVRLVDYSGFQLIRVTPFKPFHIIILAAKGDDLPDNFQFLRRDAEFRCDSPFPSDRRRS
jgi:SAM-dependent methyltransferase